MTSRKKIALGVLIVFVVLLLTLAVAIPWLVNVDRYRPEVIARLEQETGKPVSIGRLALTLFPKVSIRADGFAIGNPAGFPPGDLLKVGRIFAELDARALWNRQIVITSLELDQPAIGLLSSTRGQWNFEKPSAPKRVNAAARESQPLFSLGVISKVKLDRGRFTLAGQLPSGAAGAPYFEARGVSCRLEHVDLVTLIAPASAFPAQPRDPRGVAGIFRLTSLAFASPPPAQPAAEGTFRADSLRFDAIEGTDVKARLRLFAKQSYVDDLDLDLCGGRVKGNFSVDFETQNLRYHATAQLGGVDMARLLAAFPGARGKMTGKMEGHLNLSGEVTHAADASAGMRGTGELTIRNGNLPSLQLNKNLMQLARLSALGAASGDPSSFSSISADLNLVNQRITSHRIVVVGNGLSMDGSGSLSLAGQGSLDYQGVAKLDARPNDLTNILAGLSGATLANGKMILPFNLEGTLQNPRFRLKPAGPGQAGALPGQTPVPGLQTQKPADLVQGLAGLLRKKKRQPPQQPGNP